MTTSHTSKQIGSHGVPIFTWFAKDSSSRSRSHSSLQKCVTRASEATHALQAEALQATKSWGTMNVAVDDIEDETDEEDYHPVRKRLVRFFQLKKVDLLLAVVIFLNLCCMVVETDYGAKDLEPPGWVKITSLLFILFYSAELFLRLVAFRCRFFHSKANVFDLLIVTMDFCFLTIDIVASDVELPSLSYLRVFRLLRLGRTMKVLVMFPELTRMVNSLMSACKKVMWGGLLLVMTLFLWALLSVQIIHPLNKQIADDGHYEGSCTRCPRAYESVFQACITIVQNLVAGDSWGSVNVVIVEIYPASLIFFALMLLSLGLIMLNLITAMIVDGAQDARQQEDRTLAQLKDQQYEDATTRLQSLCEAVDYDHSGTLTREELKRGFESNQDFQDTLKILDISSNDIDVLFEILDTDKSGDIDYVEFVEQMHRMRCDDMHTLIVFIKYYVMELHTKVDHQMKTLKDWLSPLSGDLSCNVPLESVLAGATTPKSGCSDANDGVGKLMLTQILNHMARGISDQQKQFTALCNVFSHSSHSNDIALLSESTTAVATSRTPRARSSSFSCAI